MLSEQESADSIEQEDREFVMEILEMTEYQKILLNKVIQYFIISENQKT